MGQSIGSKIILQTEYGVQLVDERRARFLAVAANAEVVRARGGRIVRVILRSHTNEQPAAARGGNPQSHIHRAETETNPPRVWEYKGFCRGTRGGS